MNADIKEAHFAVHTTSLPIRPNLCKLLFTHSVKNGQARIKLVWCDRELGERAGGAALWQGTRGYLE